mgnify:FL=1
MALTRLKNVFTSKTGRCLYVNSDDFDASDSFENRGNSPNRPFKSIQRALIEAARFSYKSGQFNDTFESFSIVLYPGDYVIDNRPGTNTAGQAYIPSDIAELSASSDMTLTDESGNVNPNNILYKFNSIEGGVIVPRGTSIVGMDLRKTKIRPLYVPDPTSGSIANSAIFRVTGGCYFWQFSFFDGITQGVYKDPAQPSASSPPTFSHHKLTCFEYADGKNIQSTVNSTAGVALTTNDLALYYQKVAKAWQDIPDSTSVISSDELQARVEENRIVGPNTAGPKTIGSIVTDFVSTNVFTTTAEVTTSDAHGFSVGTPVLLEGVTGTDAARFNGSFFISAIPTPTTFRYTIKNPGTGAPSGNPTAGGSSVKVEVDNVDSSSPYIFNISLRSTWGMQGMHADGSKATGFKSMVVAQFTGVSLQKDDNAFIKWDGSAYIAGSHTDGDSIYKATYRNHHVKASNDSVIQAVSVFAVGFADHFVAESGGDQSITNSNSNFGSCALRAKGFKGTPFTQDKAGTITHVIPPQKLARTYAIVSGTTFTLTFNNKTVAATNNTHGIVAGDYVRFGTADNIESYLISAVNGTSGELTLNRGYRNLNAASSGAGIAAYKGTVSEIPVGYVALDVQKIQDNSSQGNANWAINQSGITLGDSRVNGGNAYLATAVAGSGSTAGAGGGPVHTSGTVVDNEVTWAYIGAVNTRLYLYGYTSVATKPPYKLQGFSIGARKQDKMYVSLIDGSTQTTFSALITPDGTTSPADSKYTDITVQGYTPGDTNHPLQYDTYHQNWYLRVTAATSGDSSVNGTTGYKGIHYHLGNETFYADSLFTGSAYTQRIADNRSSRDRTYRMRYTVDNSTSLSREPINGYVIQPRNVPTGQSYADVFYIYDIQTEQELKKSVQDGIYYMTVLKGSISPTNGNLTQFSFAQNINNLYPTLDKDNPTEDPGEATSVASNTVVGLVETTNGSSVEDLSLSITKESMGDWIIETRNSYTNASTSDVAVDGFITLEARDGEATEVDTLLRMVPVNATGGTATELRRPSILRSGNHTFEYVGFGPGNYSTGLPSVQNRVLTDAETLLAQSQKEDGGIAFYSGLNSNGDLFIGNTRISAVTGEEASLDTPTLSIVGETANLRPVFDEIIIRDKITVENTNLSSVFKGSVEVNQDVTVTGNMEAADVTIKGEASSNEATKKLNVVTQTPSTANAANTGDMSFLGNITAGNHLGFYWTGAAWAKFGLSDTGNLKITGGSASGSTWTDGAGDLQFKNGLGIDIESTGTLNVNSGATTLGGNLTVTGTSEFNGTVDVDANFAVRSGTTDKMTVASSTGNIYTAGGLAVDGNTDLGSDANDTLTILARVDSDLDPSGNGTKDFGQSDRQWKDGYFGGTVNATTFAGALTGNVTGNVTAASGSSSFNDLTVNGTLTGSISGNAGSATQLETARNIGGVSFNGTADINLPGVNSGGNQDTSGTAAKATDINIDETSTNGNFQVTFSNAGGVTSQSGNHYRQYIDNDNAHFLYNPSTYTLSGLNSVQSGIFGTSSQNAYGARTVSTSGPSGGSDGDIWYKY